MPRYEHRVHIDAPAASIWVVWQNLAAYPQWANTFQTVEPLGPGPFAVGKQVRIDVIGAGDGIFTITELEEGRRFAWENDYRGVHTMADHAIEQEASGCSVTLSVEMSGIMSVLFRPLIARVSRRNLPLEAEGLKRHCESR